MKKITLLTFLLLTLQLTFVQASQESKMLYEAESIVPFDQHVDQVVAALPSMVQTFTFLQEQGLVDQSFCQFIQTRLIRDDVENEDEHDVNFGEVLEQAQDLITENMRNKFISILDTAIKECEPLDQFQDQIFLFVMQHKDDFMHGMVNLWLYEWSKIKDINGDTRLHTAVRFNSLEIVRMLIDVGANINQQNNDGETPLKRASCYNHSEIVRVLIDAGADVNIQDNNGGAPLHRAFNPGIARMLIDAGANLNIKNNDGRTPLHIAAYFNSLEVASILITAGANLNIQDNNGRTAEQRAYIPEMHALFEQTRMNRHQDAACCIIS